MVSITGMTFLRYYSTVSVALLSTLFLFLNGVHHSVSFKSFCLVLNLCYKSCTSVSVAVALLSNSLFNLHHFIYFLVSFPSRCGAGEPARIA